MLLLQYGQIDAFGDLMTPARPAIAPFVAAVWFSAAMSCSATTEALDGLPHMHLGAIVCTVQLLSWLVF